jgi:carbonic anhydrase
MVVKGSVGINKVLHGIMKYRMNEQRNMVEQFKKVRDNPVPTAVFVTCVDSRMLPTRFTQTNVGDMFIVRNAGNLVPHRLSSSSNIYFRLSCFSSLVSVNSTATEPAVLELACVMNQVKHVVICGHSDCKAVNLLYDIHTDPTYQV